MKYLILAVKFCSLLCDAEAFGFTKSQSTQQLFRNRLRSCPPETNVKVPLFAEADEGTSATNTNVATVDLDEGGGDDVVKALGPAVSSTESVIDQKTGVTDSLSIDEETTSSSQVFMITREMKRTMIEELGYKRKDVDAIRLELVANILENRIRCPSDGMPSAWVDKDRESAKESVEESSSMMQRLENESKYPLKFPLLAVSLILFGKGFSDALITLIKVNIDFPGASLTAQFQGIPVLAIDFICVITGLGMGLWTYKTMK